MARRMSDVVDCLFTATLSLLAVTASADAQKMKDWPIHSLERPQPGIVVPAPASGPVPPPSDATVIFNGEDLSGWRTASDPAQPAAWHVANGYMEVAPGTGDIKTRDAFGDVQLHVEFATPTEVVGEGQERGNSGVYLMATYEIQVLDSYHNTTYPDGQASAVYGQFPPLVNASRPPGEWQTYDIVFHRPHFSAHGKLLSPARVTVLHNGVLVQDNVTLTGPTAHRARPPYAHHADALPILLQDHGNKVRYRNIWVRDLEKPTGTT
jgi:hypothetical protein